MRRKDKEITDQTEIEAIIKRSSVCRLGMAHGTYPYIVPLCFGYDGKTLYFHSAAKGKKLELLRKNNKVCFEFDIEPEIKSAENACKWGMKYKSVIGFGRASFEEEYERKRNALDIIMAHYSEGPLFEYSETALKNTVIIKVEIEKMTGKQSE